MFEQEAEEYGEKDLDGKYLSSVIAKDKLHAYKLGQYDGFVAGAEFVYNKANEWHFVKDGDLPKGNGLFVIYWKLGDIDNYMIFRGTINNLHEDVIAWKEIILPKEGK